MKSDSLNEKTDAYIYRQLKKSKDAKDKTEQIPLIVHVTKDWNPPEGFTEITRMGAIVAGQCDSSVVEKLQTDPEVTSIETSHSSSRYR